MSDSDLSASLMSESGSSKSGKRKASASQETVGKLWASPVQVQQYMRKVVVVDSQPIVLTAAALVCRERQTILGIRIVAFDTVLRHESGIFFRASQDQWPKLPNEKVIKSDFTTNYSLLSLMKAIGFKYLIDNSIQLTKHRVANGKVVIRLKDHSDQMSQQQAQDRTLAKLEPATQERILA